MTRLGITVRRRVLRLLEGREDGRFPGNAHSSIGPHLVETYATTPELQERVWMAAKRGAGIWMIILDATWAEYFSHAAR